MEWYEPYQLAKSTKLIRKFLIDLASMKDEVTVYGFHAAKRLENYDEAIKAMDEFTEKFTAIKRKIAIFDKELFAQLEGLEKESHLIEQMSLINLKIQMAQRSRRSAFSVPLAKIALVIPNIFSRSEKNQMFAGESISIERIIINCDRLSSVLKVFEEILRNREESDDILFKPSNVKEERVIELIDKAINQLESSNILARDVKEKLVDYLNDARAEAIVDSPKWSKIVGALVIAAAITGGLADVPDAAKTLQEVVQYILGSSVVKPLQPYLTAPEKKPEKDPSLIEV